MTLSQHLAHFESVGGSRSSTETLTQHWPLVRMKMPSLTGLGNST